LQSSTDQKGYAGADLSDLMEATGLEKGGIYRHFGSKQQLASEALDYAWKLALFPPHIEKKDVIAVN
jgi:TetR/AcrR family transcriptional repressor of nem operon